MIEYSSLLYIFSLLPNWPNFSSHFQNLKFKTYVKRSQPERSFVTGFNLLNIKSLDSSKLVLSALIEANFAGHR